ncbi:MAG: T9SS type A sorting domain-containing protein [Bacteroidales bacterium]
MKTKSFLIILWIILGLKPAFTQVVLTSAQMPLPGTVLYFCNMASPDSFSFQRTGAGLTWDLSMWPYSGYDSVLYTEPASTPYGSNFPTANLSVTMGSDGYGYISYNDNYGHLIGIAGDAGYGVMPVPLDPPLVLFNFPYTFGSSINSTAKAQIKGTGSQFGLPFDSVKLVSTIITQRAVNAWGTLILRSGTYEGTLLEKTITTRIDSAWTKVIFLGWIPIPGFPMTETDTAYNWFTELSTHPFASISYDTTGASTGGSFYAGDITSVGHMPRDEHELLLTPNPVATQAVLSAHKTMSSYTLLDIQGRQITEQEIKTTSVLLNLETLRPGIYLLRVRFSDGSVATRRFVKN